MSRVILLLRRSDYLYRARFGFAAFRAGGAAAASAGPRRSRGVHHSSTET